MLSPKFAQLATMLAAAALVVSGTPVKRDKALPTGTVPSVAYVGDNGVVDYAALLQDTAVTPVVVPIVPTATAVAPDVSSSVAASASSDAPETAATQTATPSRRGFFQEKREKRDVEPHWDAAACPSSGSSPGPVLTPDTAENFKGNNWLSQVYAQNAGAPAGFSRVYVGADGIPKGDSSSITQAIIPLSSYDVNSCKGACDYYNCQAFSVFMSRDTYVDMDTVDLSQCNNPPSVTTFSCAVFGSTITKDMINEFGQTKGDYFQTAIAAANGYVRDDIYRDISGYSGTTYPGGTTSNGDTAQYLLEVYNPNENAGAIGYSPEVCAARCDGSSNCAGFDAAEILADGNFAATQCLLYTTVIGEDQGNNAGQWGTDGKWYSFQPSVFYSKNDHNTGVILDAGFEDCTDYQSCPYWSFNGGALGVENIYPHTGLKSAYCGTVGGEGTITYNGPITTSPGSYNLKVWFYNPAARVPAQSSFRVVWNGQEVYRHTDWSATAYRQIVIPVTATASNTLVFYQRQDPSYFYLDDITLERA